MIKDISDTKLSLVPVDEVICKIDEKEITLKELCNILQDEQFKRNDRPYVFAYNSINGPPTAPEDRIGQNVSIGQKAVINVIEKRSNIRYHGKDLYERAYIFNALIQPFTNRNRTDVKQVLIDHGYNIVQ